MKAAIYFGLNKIKVDYSTPNPVMESGGALLKIYGSAICGSDIKIYKNGHRWISPPQILGHEFCGEIIEIDNKGIGLKKGDVVTAQTSIFCGRCEMCSRGIYNLCENMKAIS